MFAWLELKTHCHATEDEAKVWKSLETLCPGVHPEVSKAQGFHGNPILVLSIRTGRARDIRDFWRLLGSHGLVEPILQALGEEVDENNVLHFRLGKQEAFLGGPALADSEDAIVVRLKAIRRPGLKEGMPAEVRDSIMELVEKHVPDT